MIESSMPLLVVAITNNAALMWGYGNNKAQGKSQFNKLRSCFSSIGETLL